MCGLGMCMEGISVYMCGLGVHNIVRDNSPYISKRFIRSVNVQRTILRTRNHKWTRTSKAVSITLDLWNMFNRWFGSFSNMCSLDKMRWWFLCLLKTKELVLQVYFCIYSSIFESKYSLWIVLKSMKWDLWKCCILLLNTQDTWKSWMYWTLCVCMVGRNQNTCSC